jgi:hypothetical protein
MSRLSNRVEIERPGQNTLVLYEPQDHQLLFHESDAPNLLALGTRGTGKSTTLRWDAIIRCMMFPGFKALIIRRKLTDLRKSHLMFIGAEAKLLGANYRQTTMDVIFHHPGAADSVLQFSHCESDADIDNYLSSEWDYIGFDELPTFTLEQFLKICAAARSVLTKPFKALIRACGNPLGPGAQWMKQWFVDKNVDYAEFPDYNPDDFVMQFSTLDQNKFVNRREYEARLKNLPEHVRRAWLLGEFVTEGAYFTDFHPTKLIPGRGTVPWHVVPMVPTWKGQYAIDLPWMNITRSIDWGYFPDPAVCHWHLTLPNKHKITFKEMTWRRTLAADVARDIRKQSVGMHVVDSVCDPTMFIKTGNAPYSIGEIFEQHGVPLTPSQNDRELYGYSLHEMLNTEIDAHPSWQIVGPACPELVRTLPILQMDSHDARKIADGPDHWAISCAYFAMSLSSPSRDPVVPLIPRWMRSKRDTSQLRVVG